MTDYHLDPDPVLTRRQQKEALLIPLREEFEVSGEVEAGRLNGKSKIIHGPAQCIGRWGDCAKLNQAQIDRLLGDGFRRCKTCHPENQIFSTGISASKVALAIWYPVVRRYLAWKKRDGRRVAVYRYGPERNKDHLFPSLQEDEDGGIRALCGLSFHREQVLVAKDDVWSCAQSCPRCRNIQEHGGI